MTGGAAGGTPAVGAPGGSQPTAGTGGTTGGTAAGGAGPDPKPPAAGQGGDTPDSRPPGQPGAEAGAAQQQTPQAGRGAESYEATGQLGQGSQRRGHLQNAVANVEGDMVGGDKFVLLLGGQRRRLRVLSPLIEERVRFAYCAHQDLPDSREALKRQKVLILRGATGYGKSALAVRALLGVCQGPLYHLDSGVDFASLAEQLESDSGVIETGVGFLLDRPADIGNLGREVYEKVQGALAAAGAWMVVTVASGELADGQLLAGVKDLTGAPEPVAVVRAHTRWRLGEREADHLLARAEVREVIMELLGDAPACQQAGDLAAALCEQHESGSVDVARLREHRARLEAEDFEIWAESLPDPATRSFALAMAVLNGLPQEDIAQAARSLRGRIEDDGPYLRGTGPDGRVVRPKDPFVTPLRRRLVQLRAQELDQPDGEPGKVLEYKDPDYARQVILHAWTQYEIQEELLDWLSELVLHPSEQVRVYAAASGLGVLAAESYRHIEQHVFRRWAQSENALRRIAVAFALSVACQDPWVREQAAALVNGWYADDSRPLGRATAARVHGLAAVSDSPVAEIARLFVIDSVTVAVAVGCALADLVADDPDAAGSVLAMLRQKAEEHRSRRAALLAFLIVAAQVVVETKDVKPAAEVPQWPTLLFLAHRREELRTPFITLWRDALNEAFFHEEAEQVIGGWAALAEQDSELREMFRLMVGAIAYGDVRSGRILRQCADAWTHSDRIVPLPLTAAMVHAQLDLERV
ncbi:hypothetical protein OG762_26400 [Streptomyces sp. NBC_01136]|uniref:hypothetical protein n=1 Tax=unclassified Streptomyces TaxID=2593676 RepID=UPI00325623A5|nr:hypothetical protein OG762_26400 [Streptomyces sp. NBC_01136]